MILTTANNYFRIFPDFSGFFGENFLFGSCDIICLTLIFFYFFYFFRFSDSDLLRSAQIHSDPLRSEQMPCLSVNYCRLLRPLFSDFPGLPGDRGPGDHAAIFVDFCVIEEVHELRRALPKGSPAYLAFIDEASQAWKNVDLNDLPGHFRKISTAFDTHAI
jgi:hypothetical protein